MCDSCKALKKKACFHGKWAKQKNESYYNS